MHRMPLRSICLVVVLVVSCLALGQTTALAQSSTFSLTIQFRNDPADGLKSDGVEPYVDLAEGRAPSVYSANGAIELVLKGSLRTMHLQFPAQGSPAGPMPLSGAFPVQMQTLISTYGGITDLTGNMSNQYSVVFYWRGPGTDNALHDYSLAFRQRNSSGVVATANATGWSVSTLTDVGRVSVNIGGKNGGWLDLADCYLPFGFTASRQIPNLRGGRK